MRETKGSFKAFILFTFPGNEEAIPTSSIWKRVKLTVLLLAALSMLLTGCDILNDSVPRDEIISYVNEHTETLAAFPYDEFSEFTKSYYGKPPKEQEEGRRRQAEFIKEHLGNDTIVKGVYAYNENITDFYCGGSGLMTHSTYTGFYHSKDDTPFARDFDGVDLVETDQGVFEWKSEDEEHQIYTEKIADNWYYYAEKWY